MFSSFNSSVPVEAAAPPAALPQASYPHNTPYSYSFPPTAHYYDYQPTLQEASARGQHQIHPSIYTNTAPYSFAPDTSLLFRAALGDSTAAENVSPYPGTPASVYVNSEEARKRKVSVAAASKAPSGTAPARAAKRSRQSTSTYTPSTTSSAATTAVHGVGPATAPPKPTPPAHPARPKECAGSHLAKEPGRHATATDVWYFVKGGAAKDNGAHPTADEVREKTRPSPDKYARLVCKLCPTSEPKSWANTKGLTETIRKHMVDKHERVWRETVVKLQLKDYDKPYEMKDGSLHSREHLPYDKDVMRDKLLRWLAVDDQSINVVDSPEFRDFVFYLKPDMDEADLPHRTRMTELIEERFEKEFNRLKDEIQNSPGRVAFTMDVWSRVNLESYLAVTAHYIHTTPAGQDVLKARLVAFHHLEGSHTGENMGRAFISIVEKLGCMAKISSITLDNASNNGTLMSEVASTLAGLEIPFDVDGNRIRCFPHVVNIAVKAGIKALDDLGIYDYDPVSKPDGFKMAFELFSDIAYQDALKADVIAKARKLIHAVRASGQRREAFEKTIRVQNELGGWGEPPQLLRVVGLLRDVDTRWSSTLIMIDRLLELYM
ncbi:ribonuclease H-like domain-containing protein, partial [Schizophyllum fasciatum]